MSKLVSNVCKTFCGITCSFEADKKWIKISKVSKILIFKKCSNSLSLQKAFLKRSYYQIVSIVKKSGLMCYAKSCYFETSTLVDFTWEIVVQQLQMKRESSVYRGTKDLYHLRLTQVSSHIFNFLLLRKPLIFLKIPPLKAENSFYNFGAPYILTLPQHGPQLISFAKWSAN